MERPGSIHLILFVVDEARHQAIIDDLRSTLKKHYGDDGALQIIDVLSMPEKAVEHEVFATPMLVRQSPEPTKKLLMNISSAQDTFDAITTQQSGDRILL